MCLARWDYGSSLDAELQKAETLECDVEPTVSSACWCERVVAFTYWQCGKTTPAIVSSSTDGNRAIVLENRPAIDESIIDKPITRWSSWMTTKTTPADRTRSSFFESVSLSLSFVLTNSRELLLLSLCFFFLSQAPLCASCTIDFLLSLFTLNTFRFIFI